MRYLKGKKLHILLALALLATGIAAYQLSTFALADEPETLPVTDLAEPLAPEVPAEPEPPAEVPMTPLEPAGPADDWALLLANLWTPLPEDYTVALKQLSGGHAVDERAYPDLQQMMDDCRAAGYQPLICSSYRTWEKQASLYERKIQRLMNAHGYSREVAAVEAGKVVAVPGTSEHQTGLALDIVDVGYQVLDEAQENTPAQQWLMAHSWEYGFILRYPSSKSDVTGIIYEPWHYRYVGRDAAKAIYEQGITLEEYLAQPAEVPMADLQPVPEEVPLTDIVT